MRASLFISLFFPRQLPFGTGVIKSSPPNPTQGLLAPCKACDDLIPVRFYQILVQTYLNHERLFFLIAKVFDSIGGLNGPIIMEEDDALLNSEADAPGHFRSSIGQVASIGGYSI